MSKDLKFGRFLKFWRGVHQLSQEDLAQALGSSPRHISRLENGSSRPSETMVKDISQVMALGERDSNHMLMAAGFAPLIKPIDFHSPELRWLRKAKGMQLRALNPYPSSLLDQASNILMVNRGWVGFFSNNLSEQLLSPINNQYQLLFHNKAGNQLVRDWENTLSVILMSLYQGAMFSDTPEDYQQHRQLALHPSVPTDWQQRAARLEPMASFRVDIEINGKLQRFYSVNSTVGAIGPAAYASEPRLTINTLFPEDTEIDLSSLLEGDLKHPLLV